MVEFGGGIFSMYETQQKVDCLQKTILQVFLMENLPRIGKNEKGGVENEEKKKHRSSRWDFTNQL